MSSCGIPLNGSDLRNLTKRILTLDIDRPNVSAISLCVLFCFFNLISMVSSSGVHF